MNRLLVRLPWLALPLLLPAAGCQSNEEITSYQVPRTDVSRAGPREEVRLLGAIIPTGEQSWFFKFMAPSSAVAEHEKEFNELIRTVKLNDEGDPPIRWVVPEGWKQLPGNQVRFATLRFGPADKPLELSITRFGGDVLANVNRWRGQVGLADMDSEKALREQKVIKDVTLGDLKVVLVDMTGPVPKGNGPAAKQGALPHEKENPGPARPEVQYTLPEGWRSVKARMFVFAAIHLPESSSATPEVTITPLSGQSGSLLENVNRWRGQIGLKSLNEEPRDIKKITVAGNEFSSLDLSGPPGPGQQRMIVAFCKKGATTWFFKIMAPSDVVAKNQAAFEAFVKSVRFDAGPGDK